MLGRKFKKFKPINYTSQVVAGTKYNVNVKVSDLEIIGLSIFEGLGRAGLKLEHAKTVALRRRRPKITRDPVKIEKIKRPRYGGRTAMRKVYRGSRTYRRF